MLKKTLNSNESQLTDLTKTFTQTTIQNEKLEEEKKEAFEKSKSLWGIIEKIKKKKSRDSTSKIDESLNSSGSVSGFLAML